MEKPLISVIIPVYNVEDYLHKCLDSIISQTYENLEIIVVNDGSTDNSAQICEEYAKKDSRIKLLHKENGGLSSARNAGLDIADGEYIGFVDSDDFIEKNMYERMLNALKEYSANLVICSYFSDREIKYPCEKSMLADVDFVFKLYLKDYIQAYACNKLYSREIFREIRYTDGILFEDMDVFLRIIQKAGKTVLLNDKLYHYVQRENSITNSKFNPRQTKCLDIIETYKEYSKKMGGIYDDLIKERIMFLSWWLLCQMSKTKDKNHVKRFVKIIRESKPCFPVTCKIDFLLLRLLAYGFNARIILSLRRWYVGINTFRIKFMKSQTC
jgi:glycosyltransferase involved in cell wall biosynthesis